MAVFFVLFCCCFLFTVSLAANFVLLLLKTSNLFPPFFFGGYGLEVGLAVVVVVNALAAVHVQTFNSSVV